MDFIWNVIYLVFSISIPGFISTLSFSLPLRAELFVILSVELKYSYLAYIYLIGNPIFQVS